MKYIFLALAILFFIPSAYAVTCTVNVSSVTRAVDEDSWGIHDSAMMGGQLKVDSDCSGYPGDTWRNFSWDRDRGVEAWVKRVRSDMDLDNKCLSWTAADTCVFGTSATTEFQNIGQSINETKWVGDRGGTAVWTLDSPPRRYANNASFCNWGGYGNLSLFNFGDCGWASPTKAGEITAQFAEAVGCNGTYKCQFAPENEPYGNNFLYGDNLTAGYGAARRIYTVNFWNNWSARVKADCPTCGLISPSLTLDAIYNVGESSGTLFARGFMGNITENATNPPDCIDFHSMYSSSKTDPYLLYTRGLDAWNLAKEYSWEDHICGTEGAAHPEDMFYQTYTRRGIATTTYAFNRAIGELGYDFYTPYIWSAYSSSADGYAIDTGCDENEHYRMVENRNSTPYTTWFYAALNRTKYLAASTNFVNATSNDANVSCVAALNGTDQLYVAVSALRFASTSVTVELVGAEVNKTYIVSNSTALTATDNDTITMPTFDIWGSEVLQVNLTLSSGGGGGGGSTTIAPLILANKVVISNGLVVMK